jgi:hypothetical protein
MSTQTAVVSLPVHKINKSCTDCTELITSIVDQLLANGHDLSELGEDRQTIIENFSYGDHLSDMTIAGNGIQLFHRAHVFFHIEKYFRDVVDDLSGVDVSSCRKWVVISEVD